MTFKGAEYELIYEINNKDADKLEEFLNKENIECESYFSWIDIFSKEKAEIQLKEIYEERYNKLSKKHKENCMNLLINVIYENDYIIDGKLISDIAEEVLEFYENKEKKRKRRKKSKDKKKDKIKHVKVKRIK